MTRLVLDGASYAFALADGSFGGLTANNVTTTDGVIGLPGEAVLGLVGTRYKGRLLLAGQGHQSGYGWLLDGTWKHLQQTALVEGETFGVSPCAFGDSALFVATSGYSYLRVDLETGERTEHLMQIGSQGFRFVDVDTPVTGDATYRAGELFEYTTRGDVVAGQGHEGGALINGHQLEPGDRRFIRFDRAGDKLALGMWDQPGNRAILHWLTVADIANLPMPVAPVVAIGRPCWLGWFTFGAATVPSNCDLRVGQLFITAGAQVIAQYVAAEEDGTLAGLERAIVAAERAHPGVPVAAYWPRGMQTGPVPSSPFVAVEAYPVAGEPDFEARVRRAVARTVYAWLVCKGYTNPGQTTDLAALVPVYARIARDCPNVRGLLVFSAGSRAGGWNDHPEIHAAWTALAAGVTAPMPIPMPPHLPNPPKPTPKPVPPKPPATAFPAAVNFAGGHVLVFLKLAGKYIGVDPSKSGTVYKDRTAGGGWEAVSLEPRGDGTFIATFSAADKVLSIQPDGSLQTRPHGTDGGYELVRAATQPDGLNLLYRADGDRVLQLLTIEDAA